MSESTFDPRFDDALIVLFLALRSSLTLQYKKGSSLVVRLKTWYHMPPPPPPTREKNIEFSFIFLL
jgi:hypothetical protein